jgi:hypothetical protein
MSERERWVVYPLLFLALGAALRDKLFDSTTTKRVVCQELTVVDQEPIGGETLGIIARIGRTETTRGDSTGGYLIVNGQVNVNGLVNARQYAYQNVPFVPALQAIFPWSADFLRGLGPAVQPRPSRPAGPKDATPQSNEAGVPAESAGSAGDENDPEVSRPAGKVDAPPFEPKLADPPESR